MAFHHLNNGRSAKAGTSAGSSSSSSLWQSHEGVTPRAKFRRMHWKAPTIMISSFIVGVIAAISHHVFYSIINQRGIQFELEQQLVTSAGTALAFLAKVSFAATSATAFTQCLWFSMRSQSVEVRLMDSMFGVLGNPWELLNFRFWLGHPILTLTAVTTWLIPLSAIFTPATISVRPRDHASLELLEVPQRDSNDPQLNVGTTSDGSYEYRGISFMLSHLTVSNLVEADMLSVPVGSGTKNLTYSLSFHGPALGCVEADNLTSSFISSAIEEFVNDTGDFLYWAGWVPPQDFGPNINGSFFENVAPNLTSPFPGLYLPSNGAAKVYQTLYFSDNTTTIPSPNGVLRVIECSLHNASYDVEFELHSNGQQIITANRTLLSGLPVMEVLPSNLSMSEAVERFNNQALMQLFGFYTFGTTKFPIGSPADSKTLGSLLSSPTLGAAILPSSIGVMDFDQFTSALEGLFQNFTLSYRYGQLPFAGSDPTNEYTSVTRTNATLLQSLNTFTYAPRGLVIAYGTAILLSSICLAFGLAAIYSNGVTYTNNFSTFLRMTRDKAFDVSIQSEEDCSGADPLPDHIADITITYIGETRHEKPRGAGGTTGIKVLSHV